jgi:hypothetical protein
VSALIGSVNGPHHNSSNVAAIVECSVGLVELRMPGADSDPAYGPCRNFDPIGARNLAALLVRAFEEAERMCARTQETAK